MIGDDPYPDDVGDSLDADLVDLDLADLDLDLAADSTDPDISGPVLFDRSWRPADHSWGETEETSRDASHGRPTGGGTADVPESGRHRAD